MTRNWNWKSVRIGSAVAALALIAAGSVMAFGVNHENTLTFTRPVALPGVTLPAGNYSFNVVDSSPDLVIVRDKARTRVFFAAFTSGVVRPPGMSLNAAVTLGEVRANEAPPITVWYEIGSPMGHKFSY